MSLGTDRLVRLVELRLLALDVREDANHVAHAGSPEIRRDPRLLDESAESDPRVRDNIGRELAD